MSVLIQSICHTLDETWSVGHQIGQLLEFPACVYLSGDMGAGKTTLCKSIISSLGYEGEVTSPTYNLIQQYPVVNGMVFHMDLYRLNDPDELEFLGIDDLWSERSLFLIEWHKRGAGRLMRADFEIKIARSVESNNTEHQSEDTIREINLSRVEK